MRLSDKLKAYREAKGVGRLVVMVDIRDYLRCHDLDSLVREIRDLSDESDLNVLLGAGLRGVLYYVVVARKADMMGV